VNLQPVHHVGVSVNVIWVTSQTEALHQFEIFAIQTWWSIQFDQFLVCCSSTSQFPRV